MVNCSFYCLVGIKAYTLYIFEREGVKYSYEQYARIQKYLYNVRYVHIRLVVKNIKILTRA